MQVSIENTSTLGRKLTISVAAERLLQEEQVKAIKYAKTMQISGFRRGKVPTNLIKQRYNEQLHSEVIHNIIDAELKNILKKKNLFPVNQPIVEEIKDKKGEDLQFVVSFEVLPEIELRSFSELELIKKVAAVNVQDIETQKYKLQEQFATWLDVTSRGVQNADKVVIDFVGKIDGKEFEYGSAKNFDLEIGSGRFIPGFEEGLIGMNLGETKELNITFPAEYGEKQLAGKQAVFEVTVNKIAAKQLAAIDTDFANKIGIADGDISKIDDQIRNNLEKQASKAQLTALRSEALEKLLAAYPIDLPESLLSEEKKVLLAEWQQQNKGLTPDVDKIKTDAEKRTSITLLLQKIIKENDLNLDQDRVQEKLNELAGLFGGADLIKRIYTENKDLYAGLQNTVLTEQVADLIIASATIKEEVVKLADFL